MVGQVSPKFGHTSPIVESILYMYMYVLSTYCSKDSSPNPDPRTRVPYLGMEFQVPVTKQQNKLQEMEKFEPVSFER